MLIDSLGDGSRMARLTLGINVAFGTLMHGLNHRFIKALEASALPTATCGYVGDPGISLKSDAKIRQTLVGLQIFSQKKIKKQTRG